ncbi:MAG: class I SAM-dependent methyltransferase [Acidimicrobiales bacterium]
MTGHDRDLIAYYSAEFETGRRSELSDFRHGLRESFLDMIGGETLAGPLLDVGAGPGLDTVEFARAGIEAIGLDLTPVHAAAIARRGLPAMTASAVDLPLATASVGAVWSMSTLMHLPADLANLAIGELVRVAAPGGPIALGTWGLGTWDGDDSEALADGPAGLPRYFRWSSDSTWLAMLERHATVEHFEAHVVDDSGEAYQFAVLRSGGGV